MSLTPFGHHGGVVSAGKGQKEPKPKRHGYKQKTPGKIDLRPRLLHPLLREALKEMAKIQADVPPRDACVEANGYGSMVVSLSVPDDDSMVEITPAATAADGDEIPTAEESEIVVQMIAL